MAEAGSTHLLKIYWQLLKPRVMTLVVFTAFAGLWIAPGELPVWKAIVAILCIAVNAGAAGALNMWFDRDIDAVMKRTKDRPIPAGAVTARATFIYGVVLTAVSFLAMGLLINWVAAWILLGANLFYVIIYTVWLKRRTPQNIVIGGAAGAFPPMIGWAAVTGDVTLVSFSLFLLIFLWTPPHFWALALYVETDYGKANIPMLPNVAGAAHTRLQILLYSLTLLPVALVPWLAGVAGGLYAIGATLFTGLFLALAIRLYMTKQTGAARALFAYSVLYLFLIFALLIVDPVGGVSFV